MSKITSKRQVTIPKRIADLLGIGPGDEVAWETEGQAIRLVPQTVPDVAELSVSERLNLFDRATERQRRRERGRQRDGRGQPDGRGWTREELYRRGIRR